METELTACHAVIIICQRCGKGYHHTPANAALCLKDRNPHYPRAWPKDGICPCGRELPAPPPIFPIITIPQGSGRAEMVAIIADAASVATASAAHPGLTVRKSESIRQLAQRLSRISACLEAGVQDSDDLDRLEHDVGIAVGCGPDRSAPSDEAGAKLETAREIVRQIRNLHVPGDAAPALTGRANA